MHLSSEKGVQPSSPLVLDVAHKPEQTTTGLQLQQSATAISAGCYNKSMLPYAISSLFIRGREYADTDAHTFGHFYTNTHTHHCSCVASATSPSQTQTLGALIQSLQFLLTHPHNLPQTQPLHKHFSQLTSSANYCCRFKKLGSLTQHQSPDHKGHKSTKPLRIKHQKVCVCVNALEVCMRSAACVTDRA